VSGRSRTVFAILAATLAGGVTSACLIGAWRAPFRPSNLGLSAPPTLPIGGLLTALALIAGHESGHLLAGLAVGFRPRLVIIGPLKIVREGTAHHPMERRWTTPNPLQRLGVKVCWLTLADR
jgi:hypothetical protein